MFEALWLGLRFMVRGSEILRRATDVRGYLLSPTLL